MKKSLIFFFGILALFSSCKNDDDTVFDQSSDTRINAKIKEYSDLLTGATDGWKATYDPQKDVCGAWKFLIKFKSDGTLTMLSDYDDNSSANAMSSKYAISVIQKPSLIFTTYSYLHRLSDPSPDFGGEAGKGLKGDFQFEIEDFRNDTLFLKGHYDKSILKLVRAKASDNVFASMSPKIAAFNNIFNNPDLPYFKILTVGSTQLELDYSAEQRILLFRYSENGAITSQLRPFEFTADGLRLTKPISIPGIATPLQNIPFSINADGSISLNLGEGVSSSISTSHTPALQYTDGLKYLELMQFTQVLRVTAPLAAAYNTLKSVPNFKGCQFYVGYGASKLNMIALYCPTATGGAWHRYAMKWVMSPTGVLNMTLLGFYDKTAPTYYPTVKPFFDELTSADGYTVLNPEEGPGNGINFTITLVSRKDSHKRITLYK